jgi:hypothetical protein
MAVREPKTVYLDLGLWYALGEANADHPRQSTHPDILAKLAARAEAGDLRFPLSAVHYIELTENPRDHQRREATRVMAALSRFVTMAPLGRIVDEELAASFHERYGRPAFPIKVPRFGVGYRYAFGETTDPDEEINELKEYLVLEGAPQAQRADIPNYDAYAARRISDSELKSFNVMLNTLRTDPEIAKRPLDAICARQLIEDIGDNFVRARYSAGFVHSWPPGLRDKAALTDFLLSLPSRRTAAMIQFHYLKDVGREWNINDLRDILALSAAIPYCDLVVTDRKAWDVTKNRAHLDEQFDTEIFCSLDDLVNHLGL